MRDPKDILRNRRGPAVSPYTTRESSYSNVLVLDSRDQGNTVTESPPSGKQHHIALVIEKGDDADGESQVSETCCLDLNLKSHKHNNSNKNKNNLNPMEISFDERRHHPALAVPDKYYKDCVLLGGSHKSKKEDTNYCDGPSCCRGCALYSLVGVLFLLIVGAMIDRQPLYIRGVRPKSHCRYSQNAKDSSCANVINYVTSGERLPAASTA